MTFDASGESFISIGDDRNIRFWKSCPSAAEATSYIPGEETDDTETEGITTPKHTIITKVKLMGLLLLTN